MASVCIIGAGPLGGAIADALACGGQARRILLVDAAAGVAAGKALDIQQSGAIRGASARLAGAADSSLASGSDVFVIADRHGPPTDEWQGDAGIGMLRDLAPRLGEAPVVFAGSAQAALLHAARDLGVPRGRLVGSSAEALAAAARALVGLAAGTSPNEVALVVAGTPDGGFLIPWRDASIAGVRLERQLTPPQITTLEARLRSLWPPGPLALGRAAARVVEALVSGSRRRLHVLTLLDGEFGVRGRVGALPALLSPGGIARLQPPDLDARDRVRLDNALAEPSGPLRSPGLR